MAARHDHAAIPFIAGQRDQFRGVSYRFGGDPQISLALGDEFGDLHRVALVEQQSHLGKAFGELLDCRRQHVARLGVGRRDAQRSFIACAMLVADALEAGGVDQQQAGAFDDQAARFREAGEALAVADENHHAQLVLEQAHLFADAGLRCEQTFRRVGNIEAMIYNGDEVAQLLQIHGVRVAADPVIIVGARIRRGAPCARRAKWPSTFPSIPPIPNPG